MQQQPDIQPQPPQRKRRKWPWIVGIILVFVVIGAIANAGNNNQTSSPVVIPTTIPTTTPTATPNPLAGPVFGGTLDAFTAKYGQPSNSIGDFHFYQNQNHNLQVGFTSDTHLVDNMVVGAPQGQSWTMTMGITQCNAFLPKDAMFVKEFPVVDTGKIYKGVAKIYTSEALGRVFPANKFIDQQHQPMAPGSFTVEYTYHFDQIKQTWDKNQFLQCEIYLGIPDYLKTS